MWLALFALFLAVLAIIGGIIGGGIYTIVLFVLAAIIAVPALAWGLRGGFVGARARQERSAAPSPLPSSAHANTAPRPSTPDDLVDARQQQQ